MAFTVGQPASLTELQNRLVALETAAAKPAFLSGAGAPAATLGANGDHYLNNANGELFKKVSGAWSRLGQVWLDTSP